MQLKNTFKFFAPAIVTLMAGCATIPKVAYKQDQLAFEPSDKIASVAEAKEALKLLQDTSVFPDFKVSDVELGEFGVIIKGFETQRSTTESSVFVIPIGRKFAAGVGNSSTTNQVERDQLNIWYKDIKAIYAYKQLAFHPDAHEGQQSPALERYVCYLSMSDGLEKTFAGISETEVKRLAFAFSKLSGVDVSPMIYYPRSGAVVDEQSKCVVALKIGGAFERAGVPLFSEVDEIDGQGYSENSGVAQDVRNLSLGVHRIKCLSLGALVGKDYQVVITDQD